MMTSSNIRQRFLDFFEKRNHTIIPSAPLLPTDDGSGRNITLFNVAGMQPLMPYLLGKEHPDGKRLANSQKCIRTVDIDEVGDNTHATFFEMLGNWSLGDYFKEEAIAWSYEFLTNKEEGLGLDPARLYVTVFSGNDAVPQDDEAVEIWKQHMPEHRIYYRDGKDNWWTAGPDSPAGPSTEMFYDLTEEGLGDLSPEAFEAADEAQQVVEIWNNVFMAYEQVDGKVVGELPNKNVDTGAGLERMTAVLQNKASIFETDLFEPMVQYIQEASLSSEDALKQKRARIIADHIKASVFLLSEDLKPSNTDRGYILRRLLRRAMAQGQALGLKVGQLLQVSQICKDIYKDIYPGLLDTQAYQTMQDEFSKFEKTLEKGLREFEKGERDAFVLFTTYGFPLEMTVELAREQGEEIDLVDFDKKMKDHQKKSQTASAGTFKGGLADAENPEVIKLHTAHHLLLAALQQVLGPEVKQRGSNITPERLRIDFMCDRKMTPEEKEDVTQLVNGWIDAGLSVVKRTMPRDEAEQLGAEMEFGVKYPDMVDVYFVEDAKGTVVSMEFCGGPHVSNTSELAANPGGTPKTFRIKKEESSSAGVRRIKAVLE